MKLPLKLASQFSKIEVSQNDTVRNRCAVCHIGTMSFQALPSGQPSTDFLLSQNDTVRNRCAVCHIGTMNFQVLLSGQQSNDFSLSQCDTINGTISIMRFDGY